MTKTTVSPKIDQEIKPGALISATVTLTGNGGAIIGWRHQPPKSDKGNMCYPMDNRRDDAFGSIEEACHAIVQAAGGNSEYVADDAAEEAAEGEK